MLSCATGHDALALCQRFWHFYGMGLTLDISTTADGVCILEFQTQPALVPATHRHVVLEAVIAGFVRGITGLQRIAPEHFTIWFDLEQPAYAEQVRQRLGDVHWGMPTNCIRLPAHLLDKPLPQASPLALQDAVSQCEQAERLLGKRTDDIAERVRESRPEMPLRLALIGPVMPMFEPKAAGSPSAMTKWSMCTPVSCSTVWMVRLGPP